MVYCGEVTTGGEVVTFTGSEIGDKAGEGTVKSSIVLEWLGGVAGEDVRGDIVESLDTELQLSSTTSVLDPLASC